MPTDFYELLDVTRDASDRGIKRSYRRKVKEYHPDVNDHPRAHAQFKVLKKARDVLLDPTERQAYDRLGHREYVEKRLDGSLPTTDFPGLDVAGSTNPGTSSHTAAATARRHPHPGPRASGSAERNRVRSGEAPMGGTGDRTSGTNAGDTATVAVHRLVRHLWGLVLVGTLWYLGAMGVALERAGTAPVLVGMTEVGRGLIEEPAVVAGSTTVGYGFPNVSELVMSGVGPAATVEGLLILGGFLGLLASHGCALILLRRRTIWRPSLAYLLGSVSPILGFGLNLAGIELLTVDVVLYVVVPVGSTLVFLYHRFR